LKKALYSFHCHVCATIPEKLFGLFDALSRLQNHTFGFFLVKTVIKVLKQLLEAQSGLLPPKNLHIEFVKRLIVCSNRVDKVEYKGVHFVH
jgi:hypothetical protein